MAIISIIAAMGSNFVIGKDNKLPWHIPEDFVWFKEKTKKKPVIMGRKTHESIGKKLPNRINVVITKDKGYKSPCEDIVVYNSLKEAVISYNEKEEIMIIGGAELYISAFSFVDRLYLTKIHADFDGDTYFPNFNEDEWKTTEKNIIKAEKYEVEFLIMERK